MDFLEAVQTCFQKYINFNDRARRSEFWFFILFVAIGGFILGILDLVLFESARTNHDGSIAIQLHFLKIGFDGDFNQPLSDIFGLLTTVPVISAGVRRLHDIGRTGWYFAMPFVPMLLITVLSVVLNVAGFVYFLVFLLVFLLAIALIIMLAHDEGPGSNMYGVSPKYGTEVS